MNATASDIESYDIDQVKQILFALNGTFKKLNLYFENHTIYQNALNQLKKLFDEYFNLHGDLRFEIYRDRILFGEEIVQQDNLEPNDLFYILFRDGVLWISFQAGLELWELDTFYKIVQKHMSLEVDAEDDVVTALWEFNLHGIMYEAADLDLGAEDVLEDPDARCCPDPDERRSNEEQSPPAELAAHENHFVPLNEQDDIWHLTASEREAVRKMVAEEEKLDGTDHVVDVLFYILRQLGQPGKDIDELLGTLIQELREAALNGRFAYFRDVLQKLRQHRLDMENGHHWSAPYLKRFFSSLTEPSFLNILISVASQVEDCEPEERTALKKALLLLDASAVLSLGPLLMEIKTTKMYQLLLATIGTLAGRNFSYLDKLLASGNPELVRRLVFVLGYLKDGPSRQALARLLSHGSEVVRKEALKTFLTRDGQSLNEVFGLIDDPDKSIRMLLLKHLAKEKNLQAEALLLDYLMNQRSGNKGDNDHLKAFEALGRCGSDRSIAFLEKELFKWPLLGVLRSPRSKRRQAALVALKALNTPKAAKLTTREARGFFGNIFRKP
jgi:hypothetical protein